MRSAKERLHHLLELAAQGGGARAQLARELSDILLDWPSEYSDAARLPFETLLEKTMREVDPETRTAVAARFSRRAELPVMIPNELVRSSSADRNKPARAGNAKPARPDQSPADFDEGALLCLARDGGASFSGILARALGVAHETAIDILDDVSAQALAIACKGAHAGRATFSALAVLSDRSRASDVTYSRLASYDAVSQAAAEQRLASWRSRRTVKAFGLAAAE